jgi:CHAT domain-containing protein
VHLLVEKGRKEEAWSFSERARSRAFLDMLANSRIDFRSKASPALARAIEEKEREIVSLRSRMDREKDTQRKKECGAALLALQSRYQEALEHLKLEDPEYASLKSVQVCALEEIKKLVDRDTLVLEYFIGAEWSCLFILDSDGLEVAEIHCPEEALRNRISLLRSMILSCRDCKKEIAELSELLLGYEPVRKALPAHRKVVVIPHGELHYIPFCLLTDRDGQYLVKNHSLVTQPSASVWKICAKRKRNDAGSISAYALGDMSVSF